ncbi:MAG: two-component sensor histidine kinase [Desulfuromonas sp.]|nr:MAG: two-component sensor histidine kinase [Desulfuromonas sp.]
MRSLFVKIFLYFLLIIVISAVIGIVLTYSRDHEFPPMGHKHFAKQALAEYGRAAVQIYEQGGSPALETYMEELRQTADVHVFLFSARGETLATFSVPKRIGRLIKRMAERAFITDKLIFSERRELPWMASPLSSSSGNRYVIVVGLPERPALRHIFKAMPPAIFGSRALVILAVAALVCFFLARSLTSPIRKLRQATRQFAGCDLTTRIGPEIQGKGEFSDLGRDFDFMAERIETLITTQKRLLQDISHELRSPLARMAVALELARQRSGNESRGALERIEMEAGQLNEMIGQLLRLTQLESGIGSYRVERFDLRALLRSVVLDADFEAGGHGRNVALTACDPVFVEGAEVMLRRAIENVVRNAVKYTGEGTTVEVSQIADPQQGQVRIAVRDRGPGVPEESLEKLFEPFFRVADARDRESGGTGLGLAIADRAIRLSGGTICAENAVGGGLLVSIVLPISAAGSGRLK